MSNTKVIFQAKQVVVLHLFLHLLKKVAKKQSAEVPAKERDAREEPNNYFILSAMYFSKYCLLTNNGVVKDPLLERLLLELVPFVVPFI